MPHWRTEKSFSEWTDTPLWDSHIHLCAGEVPQVAKHSIALASWLPGDPKTSLLDQIREWRTEHPDTPVMLNASSPAEFKSAMDELWFPGVGELNIRKRWEYGVVTDAVDGIWQLGLKLGKPIYVHWDMDSDEQARILNSALNENPETKILLCHLGCSSELTDEQNLKAVSRFAELQRNHPNLWGDISWVTLDLVEKFPTTLTELDKNRILCGSDLCRLREGSIQAEHRRDQLLRMEDKIDTAKNIGVLFGQNLRLR